MYAARALLRSKAKFATFATSYCNEEYWDLNPKGAILLKRGRNPSDALRDIFLNTRQNMHLSVQPPLSLLFIKQL